MEEIVNLGDKEVKEIIKDFPIKPFGNRVIITLNREEVDGNLVLSNNTLDDEQYVIAVGSRVMECEPGDVVILDLEKMTVNARVEHDQYQTVPQIKVDPIEIDGVVYGFVNDNCFKGKYKL